MEKKQSSLDYLIEQLFKTRNNSTEVKETSESIIQQAKAMHKKEIEDAYIECWMNDGGNGFHKVKEAEEYYNETFGGNNE